MSAANIDDTDVVLNVALIGWRETEYRIQTVISIMKNKEISRKTNMGVCGVAIRPVVTYEAGTMILTKDEEEKLRRFERKMAKKIYGPKKAVEGIYQKLMN